MANKKPTNTKKTSNITAKFVKLSSQFTAPTIGINYTDQYVKYGEDNQYPYYLQDLLRDSGLHRAIIERKVNMLVGSELTYEDNDTELWQPNPYESLEELLRKCAYDLESYGAYYLQVIWERGGKKIAEVYHMDYVNMRVDLPNDMGYTTDFLYWNNPIDKIKSWNQSADYVELPAFNMNNKKEAQILFIKPYSPTNKYYGSPIYEGALLDIQTYAEISNYHNSNIHNNFAPGYTIFFRGPEVPEEQQDDIVDSLRDKYSGSENTGKPMVFFLDGEQEAPQIETVDGSDLDKRFEQLINTIKDNIAISHQIPRQVVGLESAGSLGNSKEILQASQMFRSDYIEPHQNILLRGFNMIMAVNGLPDLTIVNPNPNVLLYDMDELLEILSQNEVRDLLGYEETEEKIMDEVDVVPDEIIEVDKNNEEIITEEDDK